ncbi:MAG: DUF805 domain-containing protein [Alphaproteobacteria bacterium]|nr:MAG: DUF805 domain-containing protein [Alphaproteobacteria bacterium]
MTFAAAVRTCLARFADFSGRAPRSEFWWYVLFLMAADAVLTRLDAALLGTPVVPFLSGIFSLAMLLPTVAVAVRRLHDLDKAGWWYLLVLVPLVGVIVLIVWFASPGTPGGNSFGPDPLGGDATDNGEGAGRLVPTPIPRVPRRHARHDRR